MSCEEPQIAQFTECTAMNKDDGTWRFPNDGEDSRGCYTAANYVCEMMQEGEIRPVPSVQPPVDTPCVESKGWYGYQATIRINRI